MPSLPREILAAVSRHVPDVLVPAAAQAAILQFAGRLPPAFTWLGYECRLAADDDRIDFAGCCEVWSGDRRRLAEALVHEPGLAGTGPAALVDLWARPDSALFATCPAVWLEFDFLGAGPPTTFAFLCIDPACADSFGSRAPAPAPPSLDTLMAVAACGARLLAPELTDGALGVLRRCIAALPFGARALHVAATPHRGHNDLRMHFALLVRDVPRWLTEVDWPGDHEALHAALALLGDGFRQVGVQLSAGDRLRPACGIEAYVAHGPDEFPAWSATFASLTALGVCAPAKAEALFRWWGRETTDLPSTMCPVRLSRQFYLKLTLASEGLQAKAYLAIFPRHVPM